MSDTKTPDVKASMNQLETLLEEYLGQKAPAMPDNIKETLVSFAPYLAILGIVVTIPALFALLGIGALVGPFSAFMGPGYLMHYGVMYMVGMAGLAISAVLEALAIGGLFKRSMSAWRLMYYSTLVSFVASVLQGSLVSALIGAVIGLYILFQVKAKYK
jgi:membrane-associated HD superfamily phosphohydrolase